MFVRLTVVIKSTYNKNIYKRTSGMNEKNLYIVMYFDRSLNFDIVRDR